MAIRPILIYPDPRLHTVANKVSGVNDEIRQLIEDMAETMYAAPGIGLAAIQVNEPLQIIVIDVTPEKTHLQVFINPQILEAEGEEECEEGCLSVPGIYDWVKRAKKIRVTALNKEGETFEILAEGMMAVCIQHEMDHLLGRVFVEKLSRLKHQRILTKLKKRQREKQGS